MDEHVQKICIKITTPVDRFLLIFEAQAITLKTYTYHVTNFYHFLVEGHLFNLDTLVFFSIKGPS